MHIFFVILFFFFIFANTLSARAEGACCQWIEDNKNVCTTYSSVEEGEPYCKELSGKLFPGRYCNTVTYLCEYPQGKLYLQVPFPGSKAIEETAKNNTQGLLAKYIVAIFQFLVWAAISLAIFMIMVAGFIWLISAGNQGMIGKAKGYITNALYGLIIALTSYIILQTINPKLVELKMPAINAVEKVTAPGDQCCYETTSKEVKDKIKLFKGQTCQDAFGALGGTWEKCTACVCEIDYRPQGGAMHSLHCDNNVSETDCNSLTSSRDMRKCTYYPGTSCELLKAQGKIQDYTPLGTLMFKAK